MAGRTINYHGNQKIYDTEQIEEKLVETIGAANTYTDSKTGNLDNLKTNNKTNLTAAINELKDSKLAIADIDTALDITSTDPVQNKVLAALIPNTASPLNQLADKNFVNSSISTNTAHYISNNGEPFTSVAQLEAYTGVVTQNDYAFVTGTEEGNIFYDRYKADVVDESVTWGKEYRLNNSSFTAEQWAAVNSGATEEKINQIASKQDALNEDQLAAVNSGITEELVAQIGEGSALVPSITQAEYDELTEEEKNNGQIREITDAPETEATFINMYEGSPIGAVFDYVGNNIPSGFLLCDGRAVSRTVYSELFAVIGTKFGAGDGSTTFNLPPTEGRVTQGTYSNPGELIEAGIPNITGTYVGGNIYTGAFGAGTNAENNGFTTTAHTDLRIHSFNAKNGETKTDGTLKTVESEKVYGKSDTVQPKALTTYKIIHAVRTTGNLAEDIELNDSLTTNTNVWSAEKVKNTVDNITDYSMEETVVGTWIDGKPIYRKVVEGTFNCQNAWVNVTPNVNVEYIISTKAMGIVNNASTGNMSVETMIGNGYLQIYKQQLNFVAKKVVFEYTKTTD